MATILARPKSLSDLAGRDEISIDQFISTAIAEKLSASMTENYLKDRAGRGNHAKYEAMLAKVPDVEPEETDKPAIRMQTLAPSSIWLRRPSASDNGLRSHLKLAKNGTEIFVSN